MLPLREILLRLRRPADMEIDILPKPQTLAEEHSGEPLLQTAIGLVCPNATAFCYQQMEGMFNLWTTLLQSKNLITKNEPGWQDQAVNVFRQIDNYIQENESTPRLQRLGYISLDVVMDATKRTIAASRRSGQLRSRPGQRNASLALDLYLAAQSSFYNRVRAKRQLSRQLEISRRWRALSSCCPMLSMICNDKAERIM
jgi:hypothetical protein